MQCRVHFNELTSDERADFLLAKFEELQDLKAENLKLRKALNACKEWFESTARYDKCGHVYYNCIRALENKELF